MSPDELIFGLLLSKDFTLFFKKKALPK